MKMKIAASNRWLSIFSFLIIVGFFTLFILKFSTGHYHGHAPNAFGLTILSIAVLLVCAKMSNFVEKIGVPGIIGELCTGILLGNLAYLGIPWFESMKTNDIIMFLSSLGVVILLFQAGLESDVKLMLKTGVRAVIVATAAAIIPFVVGSFIAGPLLLPNESFSTHLFLGAALTTSSVGIAATLFHNHRKMNTPEARILLGAAVMDDVLGMVMLPVITTLIVSSGNVSFASIGSTFSQAILFLIGAVVLGQLAAPKLSQVFSRIQSGAGMKFTIAFCFGLIFAFLADAIQMAPIIGAFAAGLFLDPLHFRNFESPKLIKELHEMCKGFTKHQKKVVDDLADAYSHRHIEDLIEPLGHFMIPLFFVTTGMQIDIKYLLDPKTLLIALGIVAFGMLSRVAAGFFAGKNVNKVIVGVGLVPNGEVGLVFALIGKELGVVSEPMMAIIITVMIITTLIGPVILDRLLSKE